MIPLLVRIKNTETDAAIEAGFRRSPVRIGRNDLNDLAISESFVSQWHALVRFDEQGTTFLDLGSTNGTKLAGERLEKNVEVELDVETRLTIGPLRLSFERIELRDDQILSRRASAFELGGTRRAKRGVGVDGTVELGSATGGVARGADATMADPGVSLVDARRRKDDLIALAQRQKALLATLGPLHEAYEAAYQAFAEAARAGLGEDDGTGSRQTQIELLEETFARAFEQSELRAGLGLPARTGGGGLGAGEVDVAAWAERLAPGISAGTDPSVLLERAGAALDAMAGAYMDLRLGQKQVRADLGVEAGSESENLPPELSSSRELLAYLLDPRFDSRMRLDELSRSFADVALHQIGMVHGALDGARAVLAQLSPHAIGAAKGAAITKTSFGVGDFLWPFKAAGDYYRFASKHLALSTGDGFAKHLFGASFARAYYRVTGKR